MISAYTATTPHRGLRQLLRGQRGPGRLCLHRPEYRSRGGAAGAGGVPYQLSHDAGPGRSDVCAAVRCRPRRHRPAGGGETSSFTQTNGVAYLRMVGCFYILCFLGNTFVGYFRGRGQVTVPVYGTIIQISARVILSYALIRPMGLSGVAPATGLGWVLVVSFHSLMYWRTRNR